MSKGKHVDILDTKPEGSKNRQEANEVVRLKEWQEFLEDASTYPEDLSGVEERLEERILTDKGKKRRKNALYSSLATVAAAILLILLVNTNAACANTISNIPVLGQLIEYVKFDKSLSHAIENDYIQEVAQVAWDGDKQLLLPYVLADEKNLVLFFQLPKDFELAPNEWTHISLKDMRNKSTGNKVEGFGYSTGSMSGEGIEENNGFMMQKYHFSEGSLPQSIEFEVVLEVEILEGEERAVPLEEVFEEGNPERNIKEIGNFKFQVDFEEFAEPIVHEFNKTYSVMGQSITLEEMKVYPTGTEVTFTFAKENSGLIKGLDVAVDENGKVVLEGSDGLSATHREDNSGMSVFIESDYFKKPQKQELLIRGLRLLDKDKEFITVDLENKTITPAIEGMELEKVIKGEGKANLVFSTKVFDRESFGMFNFEYKDEEGNLYKLNGEGTSTNHESMDMTTRITVEYPKSGKIILQRALTPKIMLDEPIRVELPKR